MHRSNVRDIYGIVHDVRIWHVNAAACGYIVASQIKTTDPVDCMACLSARKTPYAVLCQYHGQRFLPVREYSRQMGRPGDFWMCPACGEASEWDDDEYEYNLLPSEQ